MGFIFRRIKMREEKRVEDLIDIIIYSEELWIDGVGNRYQLKELESDHLINIILYIVRKRNQIRRRTMGRITTVSEELDISDVNSYIQQQMEKDCYNWLVSTTIFRGLLEECSRRNIMASVKSLIFDLMEEECQDNS